MKHVRPKKHLGQHFLIDNSIAERIVNSLTLNQPKQVLEIGPGMGVLTQFLLKCENAKLNLVEIDQESVNFLNINYPQLKDHVHSFDFLHLNLENEAWLNSNEQIAIIGNFPYNISTQILFKVLQYKNNIDEVVGMFQKEVAERVAAGPGSKTYGIISVLLQAFYDIEYLFTVEPTAFNPPPKVRSGVIRLSRNGVQQLDCDETTFVKVVKSTFNQRRKTVRNGLKSLPGGKLPIEHTLLTMRPEQLSVSDFVELTNLYLQHAE